jgi:hypothetical protein
MNKVRVEHITTQPTWTSRLRRPIDPIVLVGILIIATADAQELSPKPLKFELPGDAVKAIPDDNPIREVPGRLVTSRDGSIVFRSQTVGTDIPVKPANANPFRANTKNVFATEKNARELVGTLPVSVNVADRENGSVELRSNVANVWDQIKSGFKNRAIADQFQRYVADYETTTVNTLSGSSNGWICATTTNGTSQSPKLKPNNLAKLQYSIASTTFDLIGSPSANLGQDDFAKLAKLFAASDPDQLFGNYGPIAINWSLDELRRFEHAASSVASIGYFGDIKGSGFLIGDGLLLTCDHVLDLVDLKKATATFPALDDAHPPHYFEF